MKKILFCFLSLISIFFNASCSFIEYLTSPTATEKELISNAIECDISDGKITVFEDTHGGFHGDGWLYANIVFENADFREDIANRWNPLPLTENLNIVCYGGIDKQGNRRSPHIKDDEGNSRLTEINDGYYYFKDRFNENMNDRYDDSRLFNIDRYSMNYTFAIYDNVTNTLYVFEFDT